jgi:hypothetical protein
MNCTKLPASVGPVCFAARNKPGAALGVMQDKGQGYDNRNN